MAWRLSIPLLVVISAAFAGCTDYEPRKPEFRVPEDADSVLGQGSYLMKITVTQEKMTGAPIAGAAVAVFTGYEEGPFDWEFDLKFGQEVQSDWGSVDQGFDVDFGGAAYDYETAESGRSDENGRVYAYLTPGKTVTVVAGKAGYTTEKVTVVVGRSNETGSVTIPIYRELVVVEREGELGPAASTRTLFEWSPAHVNGDDLDAVMFGGPEAHPGYMQRIVGAEVTVAWVNGPLQYADFAAAAGTSASPQWVADDETQTPNSQDSEETLKLSYEDLAAVRDEALAGGRPDLFTGVQCRSASLGFPDGAVRYDVTTVAAFVGSASIVLE